MKTLKKVTIEPVFVEFIPQVMEDNKLYISEKFGACLHNCLCGCGLKTSTAFKPQWKEGWELIKHENGKVSLKPSILNRRCGSHYIITKNVANFV